MAPPFDDDDGLGREEPGQTGAARQAWRGKNPRKLLDEEIKLDPDASERAIGVRVKRRIEEMDTASFEAGEILEDSFIATIYDYWLTNNFKAALRAYRQAQAAARQAEAEARAEATAAAKAIEAAAKANEAAAKVDEVRAAAEAVTDAQARAEAEARVAEAETLAARAKAEADIALAKAAHGPVNGGNGTASAKRESEAEMDAMLDAYVDKVTELKLADRLIQMTGHQLVRLGGNAGKIGTQLVSEGFGDRVASDKFTLDQFKHELQAAWIGR